jgi:hypothetical protein
MALDLEHYRRELSKLICKVPRTRGSCSPQVERSRLHAKPVLEGSLEKITVILATWEAEIGRTEVPGQPWQKVCNRKIAGYGGTHPLSWLQEV